MLLGTDALDGAIPVTLTNGGGATAAPVGCVNGGANFGSGGSLSEAGL